ncbi:hypothetical protein HY441_01280 [Candidatus Microgenomates bacterium]|nr:hypothetical protein [Candidatus Microgenomates bacterium]
METLETNAAEYEAGVSRIVAQAVLDAGCLLEGEFIFASGIRAKYRLDMERLLNNPGKLAIVRTCLVNHPALAPADVLLAVPEGAQKLFGNFLSKALQIPLARLERPPLARSRYEFRFVSGEDAMLARQADHPRIVEDVVTTLGSVAGVVNLLDPDQQNIEAVIVWRRGEVNSAYSNGFRQHYLVEQHIPLY